MSADRNYSNFRSPFKISWQSADGSLRRMFWLKQHNNSNVRNRCGSGNAECDWRSAVVFHFYSPCVAAVDLIFLSSLVMAVGDERPWAKPLPEFTRFTRWTQKPSAQVVADLCIQPTTLSCKSTIANCTLWDSSGDFSLSIKVRDRSHWSSGLVSCHRLAVWNVQHRCKFHAISVELYRMNLYPYLSHSVVLY